MQHTTRIAGIEVPALGQGSWYIGDNPATRSREIQAIRDGIEQGMTLIDTAEMYGAGRSERLVGQAIAPYDRESLYVVSKVLPSNAGGERMARSLEASLERLGLDYLDLYLYHWRGGYPLEETVECLMELKEDGLIREWGVSNFDIDDMEELFDIPGGEECAVNQVLYHVGSRGIEYSLKPWMASNGVTLMAYCPLAQGGDLRRGIMQNGTLRQIARDHGATVAQVMLAWAVRDGNTIAIPRSSRPEHTVENAGADAITLSAAELSAIDAVYAPPAYKTYLDMQ